MRAKLTTIGLYNYDPTLFDLLTLPTGADKETAVNTILLEYGEMSVIYPDPDFYKYAIGQYSDTMEQAMKRYWDVLHMSYNPLENYDRQETYSETGTASRTKEGEGSNQVSGTDARTTGGTDQQTGSRTETPNITDTTSSPAYNTETLTTRERQTHTGSVATSDSYTTTRSGTDNLTLSRTETSTNADEESETRSGSHTSRIHGNIGVTTSQQMLMSELDIAEKNFYRWLAADFAQRFMVMLY